MHRRLLLIPIVSVIAALLPAAVLASGPPTATIRVHLTGSFVASPTDLNGQGDSNGVATAALTLNRLTGRVCWSVTAIRGISNLSSASISRGLPGKVGPVVVHLGQRWAAHGCSAAAKTLVAHIEAAPAGYYLTIWTAQKTKKGIQKYKYGLVRGQL